MIDFFQGVPTSISSLLAEAPHVIIFGAGGAGRNALKVLREQGVDVLFFCDNDSGKHGAQVDGVTVFPPEKLQDYRREVVLIGSDYCQEIARQLEGLGVKDCYYFGFAFDFVRWQGHFDAKRLLACKPRILEAYKLFSDDLSREVFAELIRLRYTARPHGVIESAFGEYFHPLVHPRPGDTVIDGGAWIGDTAVEFNRFLEGRGQIYSFEPDSDNFNLLRDTVKTHGMEGNVYPVRAGLWSRKTTLKFNTSVENTMQFQVAENGRIEIPVTSIDTFVAEHDLGVDLIKMDIEGSEIEALKGAKETIKTRKPRLQICAYHLFDDLWEIPLLIKEIYPECQLFLGHHKQNMFETIVYACG